jgi:Protein kinase domain/LytR cell envelope-related transcriptional attenuator
VHRDVKPANILVDAGPGRAEHPYLSDFGLAKGSASSTGLTGTGQFLGTPDYAAPEQISGMPARPQTDQYALACVMYTVLTGALPFPRDESMAVLWAHMYDQPPSLTAARSDLPVAAERVLARALAKSPDDRYASCGDLVDALRDALRVAPHRDAGPGRSSSAQPADRRRPDGGAQASSSRTQTVTPHPSFPPGRRLTEVPPVPAAAGAVAHPPVRPQRTGPRIGRRPVVISALIAAVLLLGGGGFGFWQYNQGEYYVGTQDGYVAIFHGTDRSLAGIALSSLVQRSALKVSQLGGSDQARLVQTISQGSMSGAQGLVGQLQGQVTQCSQQWQAVAAWRAGNAKYQAELAAASKSKGKVPVSDNPGPQPKAPDAASCASAPALGILTTTPTATPTATAKAAPALPPSAVTMDVYNGGSTAGLATSVSQALAARGYKRGAVTDATAQSQAVAAGTQVFYGVGAAANADKIAKYFGAHATALASLPARHVEVLLGTGATTVPAGLAPAGSAATTTHQTPAAAPACRYQGDPTCDSAGHQTSAPTSTCTYYQNGNVTCGNSACSYDQNGNLICPGSASPTPAPACSYDQADGQYDLCNGNGNGNNDTANDVSKPLQPTATA